MGKLRQHQFRYEAWLPWGLAMKAAMHNNDASLESLVFILVRIRIKGEIVYVSQEQQNGPS